MAGVRLKTNQQLTLKSSNPFILKTLRKVVRANDERRNQDGDRISKALRSDQDDFDANLHLVRMDSLVRMSFHTLF